MAYDGNPDQTKEIFELRSARTGTIDDHLMVGLPQMQKVSEGEKTPYASTAEGYEVRYVMRDYRLGCIITQNQIDDGINLNAVQRMVTYLGESAIETKNIEGAAVLNNAFDSSYTGGDGKELCATDHPTREGNVSNEASSPATLSESTLEQMDLDIADINKDNGFEAGLRPVSLIVPPALKFSAHRILKSMGRVGVADNDANALKDMGIFPKIIVNRYLTSSTRYFAKTNAKDGLIYHSRKEPMTSRDVEFDSDNLKIKMHARYSFDWGDFRGVFGVNI